MSLYTLSLGTKLFSKCGVFAFLFRERERVKEREREGDRKPERKKVRTET